MHTGRSVVLLSRHHADNYQRATMPLKHQPEFGPNGSLTLKTRFIAWWEGYDLSGLKRPRDDEADALSQGEGARGAAPPVDAKQRGGGTNSEITRTGRPLWNATRIQVAEKIWGPGFVSPGGSDYIPYLVKPLGLNPAMSVLDLSAGLGGAARKMAATYGAYVTGLETSKVLAEAGMKRSHDAGVAKQASISHYEPERFTVTKRFDCIFAKEAFFAVRDKDALFDAIEESLKSRGQLLFTDYVIDAANGGGAALKSWFDQEPVEPCPWRLQQMATGLQQRNFDIRINEDITEMHRGQILTAISSLTDYLSNVSLDTETKEAVVTEVELWARRVAAMGDGLKVYRFYALKPSDGTD